jgi:hypothetical protein
VGAVSHHARLRTCPFRAQAAVTVSFATSSCSTLDSSYGIHRSVTMRCLPSLPPSPAPARLPFHVAFRSPPKTPHPGHDPDATLQKPSPPHQTKAQAPSTRPTHPLTPSSPPSSLDLQPQRPHSTIPSHTCAQGSSLLEGESIGVVFGRRGKLVRRVRRTEGHVRGRWIDGGGCRHYRTR